MGITGLLPALKPIHRTKKLSDFKGQTIAVDAYVWLHKGVFSCASDLALGKPTTKYVAYAMDRVRILRHFGIEPYVVFDGGPLPAKRGTEVERQRKRAENKAKGLALTEQGKHSQAREFFTKCIDVTPQMAYQLIKALKAESVSYVVAPFEADAQLAYLERIGLVDGILTEDSDLLVFGCKNVLFKLDATAYTVVHISRADFGNVCAPASDISLVHWTDAQFRAMAILSGCDYLPSIPGIGLKTANTLLRKHKTAAQVVRAVLAEGKKRVPDGYMEHFTLAEQCFQHQKVYCPQEEKLVPLTPVPVDWPHEYEQYCGGHMDAEMAKKIATGDLDPEELLPMEDINPGFRPRGSTTSVKAANHKAKAKEVKPLPTGGLHHFFGPNAIIPPSAPLTSKQPAATTPRVSAGQASGKRTLAAVMDEDISRKKQRHKSPIKPRPSMPSKFFFPESTATRRHSLGSAVAGPSRLSYEEKENIGLDEPDASDVSLCAQAPQELDDEGVVDFDEDLYAQVEQEDGYMSPFGPSPRSRATREESQGIDDPQDGHTDDDDFVDAFSSPTSARRPRTRQGQFALASSPAPYQHDVASTTPMLTLSLNQSRTRISLSATAALAFEQVLAEDTPVAKRLFVMDAAHCASPIAPINFDLRSTLGVGTQRKWDEDVQECGETSGSATPPGSTPQTPPRGSSSQEHPRCVAAPEVIDVDELDDEFDALFEEEERFAAEAEARRAAVARGWQKKWGFNNGNSTGPLQPRADSNGNGKGKQKAQPQPALTRSFTNVGPGGLHARGRPKTQPHGQKPTLHPRLKSQSTPNVNALKPSIGRANNNSNKSSGGGRQQTTFTLSGKKKGVHPDPKSRAHKANLAFFKPRKLAPPRVPTMPQFDSDEDEIIEVRSSPPPAAAVQSRVSGVVLGLDRFRYG